MVDWFGGEKVGRWDKNGYLITAFFLGVFGFGFVAMSSVFLVGILRPSGLVLVPTAFAGLWALMWVTGVFLRRADKWIKIFNFKNNIVVKVIDNVLRNEKFLYRRLSQDGLVKRFPVKYAEIFVFENSKTEILVEKQMITGSFVEIGPISRNPDEFLELLKNRIDDAFLPKGL